ncbi:MAG: tRNA-dihydrouridine synthase [Clostridia bacterium]|nr:tRNA-dihydrouridine synthase [Clostridia bacterium]
MSATGIKIGGLVLASPVVAAPMAGVTDKIFRLLAREAGAALTFTEMISAKGLLYNNRATWELMDLRGEEGQVGVQLFGKEPQVLAKATRLAVEAGAALVDLNMGCPVPKIVKNGEGAALMRDISLAREIVAAMVEAAGGAPVTVKMRKGWDNGEVNAVEVAVAVTAAGAAAVAVHGRTRDQYYSGRADWGIIKAVREAVNVPVIGNGDIWGPQDALRMLEETGCAGVMIGRGALGNPWLFRRTRIYLQEGRLLPGPSVGERLAMALRHLRLAVEAKGEAVAVKQMRRHLAWYCKGLPGAARLREAINREDTLAGVEEIIRAYLENVS